MYLKGCVYLEIIENDEFNRWLELLLSISNDGLALIDNDCNIIKYNENFVIALSLNEEQKTHNINDYINNFSKDNQDAIYNVLNGKKVRVKIKETNYNGNPMYVVCITEYNKDILLKRMYESVISTLTDGIHAADTNGIIRIYNNAYGKLEGYNPNEVLGRHLEDIYKLNSESSLLMQAQRTKNTISNRRQIYYTQNGNKIDVVTSAFPLFYNNKLIGSAAVVTDFTQMQKLIDRNIEIEKQLAAVNDSNVMIYGDTGTGKELFSQSIHSASHRKNKPFMAINCAAIPETLLESLLFGTTKGAFTGAVDKAGLFEQTDGGTLFLDEINSMPMMLQSKLLRILETKMVTRLGDDKTIPVDVRIISSFNQNPMEAVEKGLFRNDLFFRLGVVYLSIPPLKNRLEDIDLLCFHFIEIYNKKLNKNVIGLAEEVRDLFKKFEWPGNVRQLKNAIESIMNIIDHDNKYIYLEHVPKHIIALENKMAENKSIINNSNYYNLNSQNSANIKDTDDINIFDKIKMNEYNQIIKYINKTNGNVAQAARLMGISRQKLHYKIKKYNIK